MREYIFEFTLNPYIEIRIKANSYEQAANFLDFIVKDVDDYRLKPCENELVG